MLDLRRRTAAKGIDVAALFAPPSADELDALTTAWAREEPAPAGLREEASYVLPSGDTMCVISHLVDEARRPMLACSPLHFAERVRSFLFSK